MELDDSDAPNKFDVTGRVISETNVSRGELRAHNARMEQERRGAFEQHPVPSSAGDAGEQAHSGAHGTAVADRRKTVSPEGMEKLKKHLTDGEGVQEHKETPPPHDDASDGTSISKKAKKIDKKGLKAEKAKEKEKIKDALEMINLEYQQQKRRLEKAKSKAVQKKQFQSSKETCLIIT